MAKDELNKVLLLGSGALKIGEAGEFDYSGSQAAKALREEGVKTVLVNPNIATFQTSKELVGKVYFLPVTPEFVGKVIEKEKPDGILLGFGGQTALNCGLEIAREGILQKYEVRVLGTQIQAIEKTENRLAFRKFIRGLGLKVPESHTCRSLAQTRMISSKIRFPVVVRAGYSLGGLGSGVARNRKQLLEIAQQALTLSPQILIEEYLEYWKEVEYEVVRDSNDNTITVCNMENVDPMGIHTGESIVVAPSQTLTNDEYHVLREIAIKVVKNIPIIGECNIQFALNPENGDYRIIEVNARLSRSSALASKATGYPLAYVAAKLALGKRLDELPNQVTRATTAFFEPALDYVVIKFPRWDFLKFADTSQIIGSEMQSVGEVMAIGRSFEEALQKGIRSLNVGYEGLISEEITVVGKKRLKKLLPTPSRPYDIAYNLFLGQTAAAIQKKTGIDTWFIERMKTIVDFYRQMCDTQKLTPEILERAKKLGFSDNQIAEIFGKSWMQIRKLRKKWKVLPRVCQIDTLAGEFPAKTNYLYLSYHRQEHDVVATESQQVGIIGGGPYHIGSSVEFDWCAVTCALTSQKQGLRVAMINCNPETVSTDYDMSDKLYFEELTVERVLDIVEFERCPVIPSMGGQIPNTLASKLRGQNVEFLGNPPELIDKVEDREKFSKLLDSLDISQPKWARLKTKKEALRFAKKIGYPVLVRPSYVLSGSAMFVAYSARQLTDYLRRRLLVTSEYPVVISEFIEGAKEVDFDAVAQEGKILLSALSEHVEHAGVHSGDSTLVLPAFSLNQLVVRTIEGNGRKIAKKLRINGPFNIQFLIRENGAREVMVIEANLRASRSFPFVSKVLNANFIELATKVILGKRVKSKQLARPRYFGVKVPQFSFTRLRQVDPVLRVEMSSTGEVACFGDSLEEAYLKALLSTGLSLPRRGVLVSLGDEFKEDMLPTVKLLSQLGLPLYATRNTNAFLKENEIPSRFVYKVQEKKKPSVVDIIRNKEVDLVMNLLGRQDSVLGELMKQKGAGYLIRRAAVDCQIPLFTRDTNAHLFAESLQFLKKANPGLKIKSWEDYK